MERRLRRFGRWAAPRLAGRLGAGGLAALLFAVAAYAGAHILLSPLTSPEDDGTVAVTRVVDGDTIRVRLGTRDVPVRYIGIDTPETVDPRRRVQPFGREASARNKQLVQGKRVRLEKDVSETDRYGRLLRYVYLPDGQMVNAILVQEGFAHAATFPPDVKHQQMFLQLEREAREAGRGLWGQ